MGTNFRAGRPADSLLIITVLIVAFLLPKVAYAEKRYTWMPLKPDFWAADINASGVAVGAYSHPEYGDNFAYRYVNGLASPLAVPANSSWALAINDAGQIVGNYYEHMGDGLNSFIYDRGRFSVIGEYSSVYDINNNGEALGFQVVNDQRSVFLYRDGTINFLGHTIADDVNPVALTDSGQILFTNWRSHNGYIYDNGNTTPIGFAGQAMNSAGAVAGTAQVDNGSGLCCSHAVIYQNGVTVNLGTLPTLDNSFASSINNAGQVVGWSADPGPFYGTGPRAFLYENGQMIDLTSITNFSSGPFAMIMRAVSIADSGHIVAFGCEGEAGPYCNTGRWGILRPVPEPGSAAMMLAGFALLGIYGLKTRRKAAA